LNLVNPRTRLASDAALNRPATAIMKLRLFWIDAFSPVPFAGNPAAVVPLETWLPDATMQKIAFENGVAETAFLVADPASSPSNPRYRIRWFSPVVEVDLCGHATLASACVLFRELGVTAPTITLDSRSGPLVVSTDGDKLRLNFPATPVQVQTDPSVAPIVESAIGRTPRWLGFSRFDHFAVLDDAEQIRQLQPNLDRVAAAGKRGLIVTAPGDGTCDFVSRFFAPQTGMPEDPATGSAQCALAPYWAEKLGRDKLHARQLSPRGAEFWCTVQRSAGPASSAERVAISGHATLYLRGEIMLPA
jgi:PhzF family phenazine biosynthesis protein